MDLRWERNNNNIHNYRIWFLSIKREVEAKVKIQKTVLDVKKQAPRHNVFTGNIRRAVAGRHSDVC